MKKECRRNGEVWDFERQLPPSSPAVILGLDGGTTSTVCVCMALPSTDQIPPLLSRAVAGCSNHNSVGETAARETLEQVLAEALWKSGTSRSSVRAVCLAVSGVNHPSDQQRILSWLRDLFPSHVKLSVQNDAVAALSSGTMGKLHGCVLIAGTGTIAFGFTEDGREARAAGAGPILGDWGSGYGIAAQALTAVVRAHDGRGPQTILTAKILQTLGLASSDELIGWTYADPSWARIAALVPVVVSCAEAGDQVADHILQESVKELALSVKAVVQRLCLCENGEEDDNPDVPPVGVGPGPGLEPEVKPEIPVANGTADEEGEKDEDEDEEEDDDGSAPRKKQKPLSDFSSASSLALASVAAEAGAPAKPSKKSKKKNNNVWTKSTSRKGKKKSKTPTANQEDAVLITPIPRFPDKSDDSPDSAIRLSKIYKAEKVELSDDRLSAGSSKGYRMVRATRGVQAGAWYFEVKVAKLGPTGHTRLGWSMEKGDLQAPVGYDGNSFGYRDMEGTKVHKALREKYGEGYGEGDVIGFYINLPDGDSYAPKPPHLVWYKGQRYAYPVDGKEELPQVVPGSQISFFKNGVCQGVAFTNLFGGRYYPAASMFTSPNQPNCVVKFNFGPDFEFFPQDFGVRPIPSPMSEVLYHGFYGRDDGTATKNGVASEKKQ